MGTPKTKINLTNRQDLLKCLIQIYDAKDTAQGFVYTPSDNQYHKNSILFKFLKDNNIPRTQGVMKVLMKNFVTKPSRLNSRLFWTNPVKPNLQMVDKIYKRATEIRSIEQRKGRERKQENDIQENPLFKCLKTIYLCNQNGNYFQYSKGSLQNYLKDNEVDDWVKADMYLRHNRIVTNMSDTRRQRAEYQWMLDRAPDLKLCEGIYQSINNSQTKSVQKIQPKAHIENDFKQSVVNESSIEKSIKVLQHKMNQDKVLIKEIELRMAKNQIAIDQLKEFL